MGLGAQASTQSRAQQEGEKGFFGSKLALRDLLSKKKKVDESLKLLCNIGSRSGD